jgi:hypothetical protein
MTRCVTTGGAPLIGLVPQEVNAGTLRKVINTVRFSRGLFGKPRDDAFIERDPAAAVALGQARQPSGRCRAA